MKYSIITNPKQVLRLAGTLSIKNPAYEVVFPNFLPDKFKLHGSYPDYPPGFQVSLPIALWILEGMVDEYLDDDRDVINDDGGYYIVTDNASELMRKHIPHNLNENTCEDFQEWTPEPWDAEVPWGCALWLFNNEYAVSLYAPLNTFPESIQSLLSK